MSNLAVSCRENGTWKCGTAGEFWEGLMIRDVVESTKVKSEFYSLWSNPNTLQSCPSPCGPSPSPSPSWLNPSPSPRE